MRARERIAPRGPAARPRRPTTRTSRRKLAARVWNTGGCSSWYLDRNGRNATIWPDFTFRFWGQMRRFDPQAYELTGPRHGTGAEPALAPA